KEERDEHVMDEIIENMASKLYFHGHAINRVEAKEELKLKVLSELPAGLESTMWDLYKDYEDEFQNHLPNNPLGELMNLVLALNAKIVDPQALNKPTQIKQKLRIAAIESSRFHSKYHLEQRFLYLGTGQNLEPLIRQDVISQGWGHPSPA